MKSSPQVDRPEVQSSPATERSRRLRRRFKIAILGLTLAGVVGLVLGTSVGRYGSAWLWTRAKGKVQGLIGLTPDRSDIAEEWRLKRALGVEKTAGTYRHFYDKTATPVWRRILDASGMAPKDALYRWANYDWTVVLSSRVFEADETGRSYRLRPNTRAFWSRNHSLPSGLASFFFLPDTPEVRSALADANEQAMPESFQTTNSWGCRGPEPDLTAKVRGLVIGDSFMQGLFVGDDKTPPECLARALRGVWNESVSILNTGHIGYSPEQYHQTLVEYFDRFHPHFVILSVCPNDFGEAQAVLSGKGDWEEAKYWIGKIQQFCRTRQIPCLLVPVPFEIQISGRGNQGHYPGQVSNLSEASALSYLNPVEAFTDENLRLMKEANRLNKRPATSPLFNGHLEDGHFSSLGSELWAKVVAHRLSLILDPDSARGVAGRR